MILFSFMGSWQDNKWIYSTRNSHVNAHRTYRTSTGTLINLVSYPFISSCSPYLEKKIVHPVMISMTNCWMVTILMMRVLIWGLLRSPKSKFIPDKIKITWNSWKDHKKSGGRWLWGSSLMRVLLAWHLSSPPCRDGPELTTKRAVVVLNYLLPDGLLHLTSFFTSLQR